MAVVVVVIVVVSAVVIQAFTDSKSAVVGWPLEEVITTIIRSAGVGLGNSTTVGFFESVTCLTWVVPVGLLSLPIGVILTSFTFPGVTVTFSTATSSFGTLLLTIIVFTPLTSVCFTSS